MSELFRVAVQHSQLVLAGQVGWSSRLCKQELLKEGDLLKAARQSAGKGFQSDQSHFDL